MAYGNKYRLAYTNEQNELHEVFFAYQDYTGPITDIKGAEDALHILSTGSDDDKFNFILGKQATINIWIDSNDPMTINDFIAENDTDIKVTVYFSEQYSDPVFQGFVVVEDNSQPFLDKPWPLTIKATDTFGLLKNVSFVDLDGDRFVGFMSIVDILAQIFYHVDPEQHFRTYFDWAESTMQRKATAPTADALKETVLKVDMFDGLTCYDVLDQLSRCFECRVFQQQGVIHFANLLMWNTGVANYVDYSFTAPANGIVGWQQNGQGLNEDYSHEIGKNNITVPVTEDQILYLKLPNKIIRKEFEYDQTANKLCGQDFPLDFRLPQYDQVVEGNNTLGYGSNCWEYVRLLPSMPPAQNTYVRSIVDGLGFKKDRYAVAQIANGGGELYYFNKSTFFIDNGDRLNFSFSFRIRGGTGGGSGNIPVMGITLEGDDGHWYALQKTTNATTVPSLNRWLLEPFSNRFVPQVFIQMTGGDDLSNFTNYSADSFLHDNPLPPTPTSGKIHVFLFSNNTIPGSKEYNYKDLTFTIIPNINGGFSDNIKGDFNKITSISTVKNKIDETVEISDSPKRWLKGALLKRVPAPANLAICIPQWNISTDPIITAQYRFTQAMALSQYFHSSLVNQKIEGTFRGYLTRDFIITGYKNFYIFVDDSTTKRYMLTSFDMDCAKGFWRGVFVECKPLGEIATIQDYTFDLIFDN